MAEFKEKTGPDMLKVLQKHVNNGHFIGSEVCIIINCVCCGWNKACKPYFKHALK